MDYIASLFPNKATRLCNAVLKSDQEEVFKVLLEGADPNTRMPADCKDQKFKNVKVLSVAVENGDANIVSALLKIQASTENTVDEGNAPLNRAVVLKHINIVRILLEHGADVNTRNSDYGEFPIHTAAQDGDLQMAKMLHEGGSPLDATDNFGQTPLFSAAKKGQIPMSKWLVLQGVDVSATRNDGHTAAEDAESHNHKELAEWLRHCTENPVAVVVELWKKELILAMQKTQNRISNLEKENKSLNLRNVTLGKDKRILNVIEQIIENKKDYQSHMKGEDVTIKMTF